MKDFMLQRISEVAENAGRIMLEAKGCLQVEEKSSKNDLVTQYDRKVQNYIYAELSRSFPDASFLGEEQLCTSGTADCGQFIIDPIDGTMNFTRGMDVCCCCIAYAEGGILQAGIVYNPFRGELFSASAGHGATLNGTPIHVGYRDLPHSIVMFGSSPYYADVHDTTFSLMRCLTSVALDFRRFGSAAYDLCCVACGRADAFAELTLCPWDYAAASLVVREAGGIICDTSGAPLPLDRLSSVIAGTPENFSALMAQVNAVCGTAD